jgi:hypothetical protein
MSNIERRIDKVEDTVESMVNEVSDRKARFLEMQNRAKDSPLLLLLLQLEEKHRRRSTFADLVRIAHGRPPTKDSRRG